MAKGRTAWEILTGQNKAVAVEQQLENPLQLKIGGHVTVQTIDLQQTPLIVTELWQWTRNVEGHQHKFTDYVLQAGSGDSATTTLLRLFPRADAQVELKLTHQCVTLKLFYECGWQDGGQQLLEALCDETGEFDIDRGTENEQKFWRINAKIPYLCDVVRAVDTNHNGQVDENEVDRAPYSYWDFSRLTNDEANQEYTEYLFVDLSGLVQSDGSIDGGDKSYRMWRGEEIDPRKIMSF